MTPETLKAKVSEMTNQRNSLAALLGIALVALAMLSFSNSQNERQVTLIPMMSGPITLKPNIVDRSYLRDVGLSVAYTFENMTPESAAFYEDRLIAIAHPSARGRISKQVKEMAKQWGQGQVSRAFYPREIYEDPDTNRVEITGRIRNYVGTKVTSEKDITLSMEFIYQGYSLYLKTIEELVPSESIGAQAKNVRYSNEEE